MKSKSTNIILIGLVILNIFDGSFSDPSFLDYIKLVLLIVALVLSIRSRKEG